MELVLATGLWMRLTGLLKNDRCTHGEALMLAPCKSIHTVGMRTAIDVAFLDTNSVIVASERNVPPVRLRSHPRAVAVLERRSDPGQDWPSTGESLSISFNGMA